tara:strand:- start:178 stop:546 length:369 start_codon:yes stop_codon:yes gene_type:complete
MGLLNMFLGLEDIEVNGKMHVGTFQKKFKKAFGTEIRVYKAKDDGTLNTGKGAKSAPTKSTLARICAKGQKVEDLTIKKSKTVGDIEKEFAKKMGIGIQIMLPDGSGFADNSVRLKDVAKAV